jgi:hypothetical protein
MKDRDVRRAVLGHLTRKHRHDASTRVVEEMGIWAGTVRIDVAVINGELSGYEIKSDSDTLERLPAQATLYSRVFDTVTLVVGTRHAAKAAGLVPGWWTIMHATADERGDVSIQTVRGGTQNPEPDAFLVAGLLWKEEALSILDQYGLAKGWRGRPARAIHQRLAAEIPFHEMSEHVRCALKARPNRLGQVGRNVGKVSVEQYRCPLTTSTCTALGESVMLNTPIPPTSG